MRDKIVHNLANTSLMLASKEYRMTLRTVIEVGEEALKDEKIFNELLDRCESRGVR